MKKTFVGLDVLRFGLAIYLMVYHTIHSYPQLDSLPFSEFLGLGGFATSSFFLLSGFILAHVYFGQKSTVMRGGAKDFLIKRLTNLYPIHLIALAFFAVVTIGTGGSLAKFMVATMYPGAPSFDTLTGLPLALNGLLTLLMLHTWNPLYVTINPPSWSLSVLLFFYLCFPLVAPKLLASGRKGRLLLLVWAIYLVPPFIASAMHWYGPPAAGLITSNPIVRLPEFLAGILFYGLYRSGSLQGITRIAGWKAYSLGFVVVTFIGAAEVLSHGPLFWAYIIHNGAMLPSELLLLLVAAESLEGASRTTTVWAARLGNAALSIFAIHLPLFEVFIKAQKWLSVDMSMRECFSHIGACIAASKAITPTLAYYPLYMVATVIAAVYFQEIIVVKMRDALRRRLLPKKAASQPAEQSAPADLGAVNTGAATLSNADSIAMTTKAP